MAADSPPPPASTTIAGLSDDILLEIFLCLPDVTTLARAAFACRAFLHAVRSSPAFWRRFRELHAPPLLALFLSPDMRAIVPAAAGKGSDIAAAFDGLIRNPAASYVERYSDGYAGFFSRTTNQYACYSPHSQALYIYPKKKANNFRYGGDKDAVLEFHTLYPDGQEQRPSRVVCVHRHCAWSWARVAVFSANTMEWQVVLPKMDTRVLRPYNDRCAAGKAVNGFVCWMQFRKAGYILALNTATFQFSRMDLPPPLIASISKFQLGHTKDGNFCFVSILQCMLSVWLWATDDEGVGRFMLHKMFSLCANVSKITELSEDANVVMRLMDIINGFVYLSVYLRHASPLSYYGDNDIGDPQSPKWFLSFCLETGEMNLLYKESQLMNLLYKKSHFYPKSDSDPYIMVSWPSSLINGKEDSETGVTGNISEDDGHMGTKEASPVLFAALRSFKEKLIDDGNSNFAGIDSFLLDDERNSLLSRIATLESDLAAARNCVLRIGSVNPIA